MSEEKDLMKWYVVRSVSGQENKIKEYIESEIAHHNLGDYLKQILVPTEKVVQIEMVRNIVRSVFIFLVILWCKPDWRVKCLILSNL